MSVDENYKRQSDTYMARVRKEKDCLKIVGELMASCNCQAWKILDQVLGELELRDRTQWEYKVVAYVKKAIDEVNNFVMLMFLYFWSKKKKVRCYGVTWRSKYRTCLQNGQLTLFSTWIQSDPNSKLAQQSLSLVSSTMPAFFKQQFITITEQQIDGIIEWVNFMHTPTSQSYEDVCSLVALAKDTRTLLKDDYVEKEHVILKKLIQICGRYKDCSSNLFLFMYPFTLKDKDISYFCYTYSDFLLNLDESTICNFFISLTKSSASPQLLTIIHRISLAYKTDESFCKLRAIYEQFILPHLCRRIKCCRKVEEEVYNVCQFYVMGFLKHCSLGAKGIQCVVKNVGKVGKEKVVAKWIQLISFICLQFPDLVEEVNRLCTEEFGKPVKLNKDISLQNLEQRDVIWTITMRTGKKLKNYNKFPSKMVGIRNESNQCYIISVVQALHNGMFLQRFLQQCAQIGVDKYGLLNEMRILFNQLSGVVVQKNIRVKYLKSKGPILFRQSIRQEDAFQYLIQLFERMEQQLKLLPSQLKLFKQFYQFRMEIENTCSLCKNTKQIEQYSYVLSIPHTQILQEVTKQTVPDFQCANCHKICESQLVRKLDPISKILIVHINRFSHNKGITKKQLSTQVILRQFCQYTLVGMICHLGKNVEHGHYIYYHRVNEKRWAIFNDTVVEEFELDNENEEFQRQWKSEITPYILFYQEI